MPLYWDWDRMETLSIVDRFGEIDVRYRCVDNAAASCRGEVGRSGKDLCSWDKGERAAQRLVVSSWGRSGFGFTEKADVLCDNRLSNSSLRKSPPVPVRVCSRSPVKICKQKRERSAAKIVKPGLSRLAVLRH